MRLPSERDLARYLNVSRVSLREALTVLKIMGIVETVSGQGTYIKNNGVIETDWVSIIRIRGTLRWNARVIVKRREGGTVVKVYNRIEEPSEVKGKMKDKKGDIKSGWQPSEEEVIGVGNILKILSEKLGGKPG